MGAPSDELKNSGLASFRGSVAVTQNDSTDLTTGLTRGIQCDVAGTVKATFYDDTTDTLTLLAGIPYAFQVKRIWNTGSSATGVHALY